MAETTDEMLAAMRANNAPEATGPKTIANTDGFYPRLMVLKLRRQQLTFGVGFGFVVFCAILARDHGTSRPWWLTALPIAAVGLMIACIPLSEEWEYKPWQARARQYERNQINHR